MKISYDKFSDALYIRLTDKKVGKTRQVDDGIAMDFDTNGGIVGIEILYLSKRDINPYAIACEYLQADEPKMMPSSGV